MSYDKFPRDAVSCVYLTRLQTHMCLTGDYIYELGLAASEPCNTGKHGKQKCVNSEAFITCVWRT